MKLVSRGIRYIFLITLTTVTFLYSIAIINSFIFQINNFTDNFGYMDSQESLSNVVNMINFRIPFKDYFFEYGLFFLFILSVGYVSFGQTYYALVITSFGVLPVLTTLLSIYIAKLILKNKFLVLLFMLFCLLFIVNYHYTSLRHIVAELSLALLIAYIRTKRTGYWKLSAIFAGLSLFTGLEYGVALWTGLSATYILMAVSKKKLILVSVLSKYLTVAIVSVTPIVFVLILHGTFIDFLRYNSDFMKGFYYASPCAKDSFPRVADFILNGKLLVSSGNAQHFKESFQKLNFYIVPLVYILALISTILKIPRKSGAAEDEIVKLLLAIYGLLIYIRTLNTPCLGYFNYGLIPFFLLSIIYLRDVYQSKKMGKILKLLIITGVSMWFISTRTWDLPGLSKNIEIFITNGHSKSIYFKPSGYILRADIAKAYTEVTAVIVSETNKNDYLYVYPWGPYNELTGRKYATPIFYGPVLASVAGEKYNKLIESRLESTKPKVVVINIFNNLSIAVYGKTRKDVGYYYAAEKEVGPVFASYPEANTVEKYILENYEAVYNNKVAIVMRRRPTPIAVTSKQQTCKNILTTSRKTTLWQMKTLSTNSYKPLAKNAYISANFSDAVYANEIKIEQTVDTNLITKYFGRYLFSYSLLTKDGSEIKVVNNYLSKRQPEEIRGSLETEVLVQGIKITFLDNLGIAWWLKPEKVTVQSVKLCR